MKKIYFSAILIFIAFVLVNAQLTLTKSFNCPVSGDILTYKDYDSISTLNRQIGANIVWNYSNATISTATQSSQIYTTTSSISSIPNAFSSANLVSYNVPVFPPVNYSMYKVNTNDYELLGSFSGINSITNYTNSSIQMTYPFTFGSSISDVYSGVSTSNSISYIELGTSNVLGSGTGTLILPNNLVFTNCLQVRRQLVVTRSNISPPFTTVISGTFTLYEYYDASQKFPILSLRDIKTSFLSQPPVLTTELKINTNAILLRLNESKADELSFSIFPNPIKEHLVIKNNKVLTEATTISISDITGKIVLTETMSANENLHNTDVSNLNAGVYVIQLQNKLGVTHKRFIKE